MRTFPPCNPSRRTLLVGLLIAVASAFASDVSAAANTPGCVPVPDERPRATTTHDGPEPDHALRRAVARFKANDPDVTVTFNDCEVDSFATRAKPSVPHYAKRILRAAGLPVKRNQVQLFPPPETRPKPAQDLDSPEGLRHKLPLPDEAPPEALPRRHKGDDAAPDDPRPGTPLLEQRTEPAIVLEPRVSTFAPPAPQLVERERRVAKRILLAFLAENEPVFRVGSRQLAAGLPGLHLLDYRVSRFFRAAAFSQSVKGEPVIESRTLALFDANWNVIGITRTLYTPTKLKIQKVSTIPRTRAMAAAIRTVAELTDREPETFEPRTVVLGLDSLRRERVFQVQVVDPKSPEFDFTVLLRAASGEVLNVSDNVDAFTDAKTRRWAYTNGNQKQPVQIISTGVYTRGDNTLRHDFFFLETDERGGGLFGQSACTSGGNSGKSQWRPFAWGTNDSPFSFIRHTHRSDRDFSIWSPAHGSGSFGESHAYYWSRAYFQWMKPALDELGVLPGNAADFPKLTILANACIDDIGYANSSLDVTIHLDEGETEGKVRLADMCRDGNPNCAASDYDPDLSGSFATCEGGGCHPTPSVIHHEINHRVLGGMFGIGSSLDCGAFDERKFLHEGLMGSVLPQAFWHFWNGVGFNPSNKNRLFTADAVRGRVHEDAASNLTRFDYSCGTNTSGQGPYEAGRVAGQPLWEIFHGKRVAGNQILDTYRPATDTDFLILAYWAADLMAASTFRDRWEFANRVMQILELSDWPSDAKQDYCDIFDHHELATFIDNSYCS